MSRGRAQRSTQPTDKGTNQGYNVAHHYRGLLGGQKSREEIGDGNERQPPANEEDQQHRPVRLHEEADPDRRTRAPKEGHHSEVEAEEEGTVRDRVARHLEPHRLHHLTQLERLLKHQKVYVDWQLQGKRHRVQYCSRKTVSLDTT